MKISAMKVDAMKPVILILFWAFAFSGQTQAETGKLGRLFFTPDQRARMDVARQSQRSIVLEPEQETLPEPAPATVTLNGVIAPSNGRPMVWINGRLQEQGRAPSPVIMPETGRQVSVTSPDGSSRIPLKVGQSIDTSSGKVEEGWRPNSSATTAAPGEPDKNARP